MTHELKTPLATISLAVDALRNEKVMQDRQKSNYFSSIIKEENKRMNKQVETILRAALMERHNCNSPFNIYPCAHNHPVMWWIIFNCNCMISKASNLYYSSMRKMICSKRMKFISPTWSPT